MLKRVYLGWVKFYFTFFQVQTFNLEGTRELYNLFLLFLLGLKDIQHSLHICILLKGDIKSAFCFLGIILFHFRPVTFNYLPDHHISHYNVNTVYNYAFENGYLLLGRQCFFGAATTYLLNIRSSSMEPRADSENYFNLRTVAQVNNSCFGIITTEVVNE